MKTTIRTAITSNFQVAPEAFLLSFVRCFDFLPGQVIGIALTAGAGQRLYSIASGNKEHEIRILYTVNPEGIFTPQLARLHASDFIYVSEPFGNFLGNEKPATLIATGTGIAPFASMFYSGIAFNKTIVHGSRYASGFFFSSDFQPVLMNNYVRCCSRESAEGLFHGRVSDYLSGLIVADILLPCYLCGSAEMVVEVRDLLIARGVAFDQIVAEIFF